MTPEEAFGDVLRTWRRRRGFSQEGLAAESGYHRTYISLLERGLRSPSLSTLFALAQILAVRPSELIGDVEAIAGSLRARRRVDEVSGEERSAPLPSDESPARGTSH
jgi:transcriptional regulator with XRE-family HTH domain